jgi:hypothetical protein
VKTTLDIMLSSTPTFAELQLQIQPLTGGLEDIVNIYGHHVSLATLV